MTETISPQDTAQAERKELETLLASELFRRAPTIARILEYLCERQMQGETFIKEYEIATRVMGRSGDFDPQLDGSVRVNLHHLRKKLKQYYETEGAQHAIRIALPVGQSLPSFLVQDLAPPEQSGPEAEVQRPPGEMSGTVAGGDRASINTTLAEVPPSAPACKARSRARLQVALFASLATVLLLAAVTVFWISARSRESSASQPIISDAILRIACGRSSPLHDDAGRIWSADTYASGGDVFQRPVPLSMNGGPADLYARGREGSFDYAIPLTPGTYELHLYFAESGVHGEGFRTMNILLNGTRVNFQLDITSEAGGFATPTEKIYAGVQPASDGKLHIGFRNMTGPAFVNGIEIMPGNGTRMRPVRQSTLSAYYIDPTGVMWSPDAWYAGGRVSHLREIYHDSPIGGFYQNERFGNFTYAVPVMAGHTYGLTLYLQDLWFAQPKNNKGRRVFNVICNGKELLHDFVILEHAAPGTQQVTVRFDGLEASPQGKLSLNFLPTENYASVNAMMIEDQTPATQGYQVPAPATLAK